MTSSFSYSSSSRSNGVLEIDVDRLPPYEGIPTSTPAPSIGSSPLSNRNYSCDVLTRLAVSRLSSNTEYTRSGKFIGNIRKILNDNELDFSDAEIVVDGIPVGVNRLVLASMSSLFHELFKKQKAPCGYRPRFYISDLVRNGKVGYEAFLLFLGFLYTGNLKSYPEEVSKCVDDGCPHDVCHPAIDFQLQLLCASATFQIDELVSLLQMDLFNVVEKAQVEDVIPILVVTFQYKLNLLQDHCIKRVAQSDIDNLWIDRVLPYELQLKIRLFRIESMKEANTTAGMEFPDEIRVKRIYQALDTNDVHVLHRILYESATPLDEIYGLHYAVAYCEPKLVCKILELGLANVNLRNSRGFTVLHMAARRMHPAILNFLLLHGAYALNLTSDGQSAVSICRRMTKMKDFEANEHSSKATNNSQLCIEIVERGVQATNFLSPATYTELEMRPDFLGNRVTRDANDVFFGSMNNFLYGGTSQETELQEFERACSNIKRSPKLRTYFIFAIAAVRFTRIRKRPTLQLTRLTRIRKRPMQHLMRLTRIRRPPTQQLTPILKISNNDLSHNYKAEKKSPSLP